VDVNPSLLSPKVCIQQNIIISVHKYPTIYSINISSTRFPNCRAKPVETRDPAREHPGTSVIVAARVEDDGWEADARVSAGAWNDVDMGGGEGGGTCIEVKVGIINSCNKTRGSKGPWVAYLRKRSKVTVEPFTEDH